MANASERWLSEEMSDARYLTKEDAANTYQPINTDEADPNIVTVGGIEYQRSGTAEFTQDITTSVSTGLYRSASFSVPLPPKPEGWSRQVTVSSSGSWSQWGFSVRSDPNSELIQLMCAISRKGATGSLQWSLVKG